MWTFFLFFPILCHVMTLFADDTLENEKDKYHDSLVAFKDTSTPILKGDEINILCRYTLPHPAQPNFVWYMGNRRINADLSNVFDTETNLMAADDSSIAKKYIHESVLRMNSFTTNLIGSYVCTASPADDDGSLTLGTVYVTANMFAEPEIELRPFQLIVQPNTADSVCCFYKQVDKVAIEVDDEEVMAQEVDISNTTYNVFHTLTFKSTSKVRCVGYHKGRVVKSNAVPVVFSSKYDLMCSASVDRFGGNWTAAKAPSVIQGKCPEAYNGYTYRICNSDCVWESTIFNNCMRKDLTNLMDQAKLLQALDPSAEELADVSTSLSETMPSSEPMMATDVVQTVGIMDTINAMADNESEEVMITSSVVETMADVADYLMDEMNGMDEADDMGEGDERLMHVMGARLLVTVDHLVTTSLKESTFSSKPIVKKNIVIKRNSMDSPRDVHFPDQADSRQEDFKEWLRDERMDTVFIPSSAFPGDSGTVRYSAMLYKRFKYMTSSSVDSSRANFGDKEVMSNVLAFSTERKFDFQSSGIQMTFSVPQDGFNGPVCGFLDTNASEMGMWSTAGCQTEQPSPGVVICKCNHLTNFAVLMSRSTPDSHSDALKVISFIGCTASITCLVVLIVVYAVVWKYMKKDRKIHLHLLLSICLLLVYVVLMAGVERSLNEPDCTLVACILHFLLLVVFSLMLCEGVELLMAVIYVFRSNFSVLWFLLPSLGVPLVIVSITLAVLGPEEYRNPDTCWLNWSSGAIWAFSVPALGVVLVNQVVLAVTLCILMRSMALKRSGNVHKLKVALRSIAILSPVLGFTWFFGVLSLHGGTVVFQYLFAIFNSLQGLAIFIGYCVMCQQVRDALSVFKRKQKQRGSEKFDSSSSVNSSNRKQDNASSGVSKKAPNPSRLSSYEDFLKAQPSPPPNDFSHPSKAAKERSGNKTTDTNKRRKSSATSSVLLSEYFQGNDSPDSVKRFAFTNNQMEDVDETDSGVEEASSSVYDVEYNQQQPPSTTRAMDIYFTQSSTCDDVQQYDK